MCRYRELFSNKILLFSSLLLTTHLHWQRSGPVVVPTRTTKRWWLIHKWVPRLSFQAAAVVEWDCWCRPGWLAGLLQIRAQVLLSLTTKPPTIQEEHELLTTEEANIRVILIWKQTCFRHLSFNDWIKGEILLKAFDATSRVACNCRMS